MKIVITGANSATGLALLSHLVERNNVEAVACVRSERARQALPSHPAIESHIVDYNDVDKLARVMEGADCVIHLVGILIESRKGGGTYKSSNVEATRDVVDSAERAGVNQLIFVSALGADERSSNKYLRSKGQAEKIVRSSKMRSTLIRTPLLLGPGTAGSESINQVASQRQARLLGGGRHHVRPLDVGDLSHAILNAASAAEKFDGVFDLVGPEAIEYRELIRRVARLQGNDVSIGSVPIWLAKLVASTQAIVGRSGISGDVIDVITSSEDVERNTDQFFEIELTPLDVTLANSAQAANEDHPVASQSPQELPGKKGGPPLFARLIILGITALCFAYLVYRLNGAATREGLSLFDYMASVFANVDWLSWALLMAGYSLLYFIIDTAVFWRALHWFIKPIAYTDILPIRASAYIISIVNEQVGKGAMGVYLNRRHDVPAWEVGSVILFLIFCEVFYLLFWATVGYAIARDSLPPAFDLIPILALGGSAFLTLFVMYFNGVILPKSELKDRALFHAFRRAGPQHYLMFLLMRSPAILAAVFVYTTAIGMFGVETTYLTMLGFLPVIFFSAAIPTPMRAAAIAGWVLLFPAYEGQVAAFGFVQHNFFILFNAVIGLLFLRRTQRELFGT